MHAHEQHVDHYRLLVEKRFRTTQEISKYLCCEDRTQSEAEQKRAELWDELEGIVPLLDDLHANFTAEDFEVLFREITE